MFIETESWMKKASTESCDLEVDIELDDPSLTEVKRAIERLFFSFPSLILWKLMASAFHHY